MKRDLHLSSPNMRGHDVAYAQSLLLHNEWKLNLHVGEIGHYDRTTAAATKRAKYLLGYAKPDEVFGDKLELYLRHTKPHKNIPLANRLRRRKRLHAEAQARDIGYLALQEAKRHLGAKEHPAGSNTCDPFTPWYHHYVGPWCAVFVSYCLAHVGFKYVVPGYRWAYCPYMVDDARAHRNGLRAVGHSDVRAGDIVLYDWDGGVADHVGFFEAWIVEGYSFYAIEGNTAIGNDSNGGEVMRRTRYLSNVEQFARVGA